jgi:tight adherence protein C
MITDIPQLFYTAEKWFVAVLLIMVVLSGSRLWRIVKAETTLRLRMESFRGAAAPSAAQSHRSPWHRRLSRIIAISPIIGKAEQQRLLKLLALAGIKGRSSLTNFIAIKLCGAVVFTGLGWIILEWEQPSQMLVRVGVLGGALLSGWRLPDIVVGHMIKRRKLRLEAGMPDALDLLVICSEAGLSLNQAIGEVSRQLYLSNKDAAEEFASTAAEMRVLPDFSKALDNMVERTGLDELRSLVATLKQSVKFGTSLADSLRIIAGEMRAARNARMEERAARLPVLLAMPMLMFILPCLMMVVGTPVVIRILDTFKNISIGGGP